MDADIPEMGVIFASRNTSKISKGYSGGAGSIANGLCTAPNVFSATLSPRNGKAMIGTRIKLGDSQKIVAIAETSDGKFWSASADVIVTLAACLEEST